MVSGTRLTDAAATQSPFNIASQGSSGSSGSSNLSALYAMQMRAQASAASQKKPAEEEPKEAAPLKPRTPLFNPLTFETETTPERPREVNLLSLRGLRRTKPARAR